MNVLRWLFPSLLLFVLGCASTRQYTESLPLESGGDVSHLLKDKSMARIYVFRPQAFAGSGIGFVISDNGRPVGKIGSGGIVTWERPTGLAAIGASASNEQNISVNAEAGKAYFFEVRGNWGAGFNTAACELRMLAEPEGLAKLRMRTGKK